MARRSGRSACRCGEVLAAFCVDHGVKRLAAFGSVLGERFRAVGPWVPAAARSGTGRDETLHAHCHMDAISVAVARTCLWPMPTLVSHAVARSIARATAAEVGSVPA